ncbi:sugar phosphate nucleotidyltransferase [Paenibacillus tarimensis]
MKGIILAGGTGSRLRPLTNIMNKHMIPVGGYPMAHYAVEKLKMAGIRDILLVIGKQSASLFIDYFGSGAEHGVNISYKIQEQAGGVAQALLSAEGFPDKGEKMIVLLGDNLFETSLNRHMERFSRLPEGTASVFLTKVSDPSRYGVPVFNGDKIIRIIEKPEYPPSGFCVTGIYMYDSGIFDVIRRIRPSARGEWEITDVNNIYAAEGMLSYHILNGWWMDAGTFPSLMEAHNKLAGGD